MGLLDSGLFGSGLLDSVPTCQPDDSVSCRVVFNLTGNDGLSNAAEWLIGKPLAIVALILIGLLGRWVLHRLVDRVVHRASEGVVARESGSRGWFHRRATKTVTPPPGGSRRAQRAQAMGSLLKSISTGVIFAIVTIMVISQLGYDVAPIIAGAGILGVALGFGSQTLVKDFLSGIFMIFEDQYGVGDVIDAGEATGTVEAVGLRVTRLRDVNGTVWYVRNGEVIRVGNMSQNWSRTVLDVAVSYRENVARVREILQSVAHDLWEDPRYKGVIIEEPEVWGVQSLDPDTVSVRVTLKTAPLEQWAVAREMRERIKNAFDRENVQSPFPQRVVWHRDYMPADSESRDPWARDTDRAGTASAGEHTP